MKGEFADGHAFIDKAIAAGAAGIVCETAIGHPHVRVADSAAALNALGSASRARSHGRIIGVTGSAGKTGTKEALFCCPRPFSSRQGAPLGQELQQPCRRAIEPCAHAFDRRFRRVRNGNEPRGRTRRTDAHGASARDDRHHHRSRAYGIFRQRRSDRRREGRDFRRASNPAAPRSFRSTARTMPASARRPKNMQRISSASASAPMPMCARSTGFRMARVVRSSPRRCRIRCCASPSRRPARIGWPIRSRFSPRSRRSAATFPRRGWPLPKWQDSPDAARVTVSRCPAATSSSLTKAIMPIRLRWRRRSVSSAPNPATGKL